MDPDRIARIVANLHGREFREFCRAVDLFERCGSMPAAEAHAWREALRARAAELSGPVEEA